MYKWFMAWRYLHTKLIAIFAILGVTLCVAMVLVVMSVMGGFLDMIKQNSRGLLSDIVIDSPSLQGWPYYEEFAAYLAEEYPELVEHTTPVIYNYGILRVPESSYTKPVRVVGIHLDEYEVVNSFRSGLHYERYFPGTTTLAAQKQPMAGYVGEGRIALPPDLREANRAWQTTVEKNGGKKDREALEAYRRTPYTVPPAYGERVFELGDSAPTYRGPELPGVIVGCDIINQRRNDGNFDRFYPRGQPIALTVLPLTQRGNLADVTPAKFLARYADDSRTGVYEIDSICVYVDFDLLQKELLMSPQPLADGGHTRARATQLLITLEPGHDLNESKARINAAWNEFMVSIFPGMTGDERKLMQFVEAQTWEDLQRPFIAAVEKEKVLVTVLFALISLVAIVLIGCIFYMIVQKKTRDIGILKALGASGSGVAGLFIVYAGTVGVVGSILGSIIGCTFVHYINDIQDLLVSINPQLQVWNPEVYTFDRIPNQVNPTELFWICVVAILASIMGSLIPATIAGRIWPVRALRYE